MRKLVLIWLFCAIANAQAAAQNDSIFNRTIYNKDENIYLVMNFREKNVLIEGQEFLGEMAGYLGDFQDFRKWYILEADVVDEYNANIEITNDEGSEDLKASITYDPANQTYTLQQLEGSTLRTARNRKWHKLPKKLVYTKNKK